MKKIKNILIANRGEIAIRICKTATNMGIKTTAVFSQGDINSPHVKCADFAISLNGKTSKETYLNYEKIIEAAKFANADAIHPGFGFLSEDAKFAQRVIDEGLIWIGPSPQAIQMMGDKLASKQLMEQVGVPTLPSIKISPSEISSEIVDKIGYPMLIKASAGGGGKGMRIVNEFSELEDAVMSASREALSAFGNDTIFVERYVPVSRHIEVQILGDKFGNLIHCFERECSIQRRHQKIIEEAPSPHSTPEFRKRITDAASKAAKSVQYFSAGTVEFLVDGDDFWFLEMNTRLQVEHPVTEEILGIDLVREQILVAQDETLSISQEDLKINGHSVEVRLYAEDPHAEFLPAIGQIDNWAESSIPKLRYETGIESGSQVNVEFDPMLAKVISHSNTREEAIAKLALGLEKTRIEGVKNNKGFLVEILKSQEFIEGKTTTDFIENYGQRLLEACQLTNDELFKFVAIAILSSSFSLKINRPLKSLPFGWRNTPMPKQKLNLNIEGKVYNIEYQYLKNGNLELCFENQTKEITPLNISENAIDIKISLERIHSLISGNGVKKSYTINNKSVSIIELPAFKKAELNQSEGAHYSPMPGNVLAINVAVGEAIEFGQDLLILEAMKMEYRLKAKTSGIVKSIEVNIGNQVILGQPLIIIESKDSKI